MTNPMLDAMISIAFNSAYLLDVLESRVYCLTVNYLLQYRPLDDISLS